MEQSEALRTSKQYEDALKAMKPNIIRDKLLDRPFEDPDVQKGMNVVSLSYDLARDPITYEKIKNLVQEMEVKEGVHAVEKFITDMVDRYV